MTRRQWVQVFAFALAFVAQPWRPAAQTPGASTAIAVRTATADGVSVQYLSAGSGPAIVLLHGYAETSRMWRPLIPRLAATHTVIAPDLPGIGGSAIPSDGLDMTHAAARMHALVKSLGVNNAAVVGHDIGLMVAYAYAAQFPDDVDRLVLMDAFLPGVDGWETIYNDPGIWHFRFNGPTPEALVRGRERTYFEHFWNDMAADKTRSLPEADRQAYTTRLRPAGEDARRVGVLRVVSAGRQGFRAPLTNETHHAGAVDRWREGKRRSACAAGSARGHECPIGHAAEHRPLGDGGESAGDDGRARRVSQSIGGGNDSFASERTADVAGIEVHARRRCG